MAEVFRIDLRGFEQNQTCSERSYLAKDRGNNVTRITFSPSISFEEGDGLERSSHRGVILSVNSPAMINTILDQFISLSGEVASNTYILTRTWNESDVGMINDSYLLISSGRC